MLSKKKREVLLNVVLCILLVIPIAYGHGDDDGHDEMMARESNISFHDRLVDWSIKIVIYA